MIAADGVTFQVSLGGPGLPGLHKDGERDHVSNHDGKSQADHEGHGQEAVEEAAAALGAERRQRVVRAGTGLGDGSAQVERRLAR